ncbi:MAG TPA: hypothetical protein VFB32_04935 [Rudaea sp.]|nr:hypothetical protein [Rudaea sp.]
MSRVIACIAVMMCLIFGALAVAAPATPPVATSAATPPPSPPQAAAELKSELAAQEQRSLDFYKELVKEQEEVAKKAIEASAASVERIKDLMEMISALLIAVGGVFTFFGIREFRQFSALKRKILADKDKIDQAVEKAEKHVLALEANLASHTQRSLAIHNLMIDLAATRFKYLLYLPKRADPSSKTERDKLIQEARKIETESQGLPGAERMYSWSLAQLGALYADDQNFEKALDYGKLSYDNNPQKYMDRAYNVSCSASRAWRATRKPAMLDTCEEWLRKAIDLDVRAKELARADEDFDETREQPRIKALL